MSNARKLLVLAFVAASGSLLGQVGIGTASPTEALDIEHDSTGFVNIGINNSSTGDPMIHFQTAGSTYFTVGVDNSDGDKFKIGTTALETTSSIIIDSNGDVGVVDTDPAYKLEVDSCTNLSNSTDVYRIGSAHALSKPNTKNIYVGRDAGAQNNAAGTDNVFIGYQSGYSNTSGDYNVQVGTDVAYTNQSGSNNVSVGYQAGYSGTTGANNVKIGYQAGYGETGSNTLYIDNSSTSNPLIYSADFTADDLVFNGSLVVNEQSATEDFRVESDNATHQLYVDATNDMVKINTANSIASTGSNKIFQVSGTDDKSGIIITNHQTAATGPVYGVTKARGTEASPTVVVDNDNLGPIKFNPHDGINYDHTGATIEGKVDGTPGSDDLPTEIRLQTCPDGTTTQQIRMVVRADGTVGIGDTSPDSKFDVEEDGATVATFNRLTDNSVIIDFQQATVSQGSISYNGTDILYNAFSGAHFAQLFTKSMEYGEVAVLNGENENLHGKKKGEVIYGVERSSFPNEKRVLGAYSGLLNPQTIFSLSNPHQVVAVGNGPMVVTNEGGNIKPGDYLITSSVPGAAMKDNGDFPVSYVIARASEKVNWRKIKADSDGVKRTTITVLYESFEVENIGEEIKVFERELEMLKNSLHKS